MRQTIHFPGLNSLRFFAAMAVVITHIELVKNAFHIQNIWKDTLVMQLGPMGVVFFFVLSGFLITYLLYAEKQSHKTIFVKDFYLRRIFRIWPLYYLIFVLGFFILPQFSHINISYLIAGFNLHYWKHFFSYLLLFPNLAYSFYGPVPHIGQLWSIGVEEQFYILWPAVVKYISFKKLLPFFVGLVVVLVAIKVVYIVLVYQQGSFYLEGIKKLLAMNKFECMAIGAIAAHLLYHKSEMIGWLSRSIVFNGAMLCLPILIYFTPDAIQDGIHIVYSALFAVVILNVSMGKGLSGLNSRWLNGLGKISYGIYMYHFMVIPMVLWLMKPYYSSSSSLLWNMALYLVVISCTIGISAISYYGFEKRILKYKSAYSHVKSAS